MLPGAATSPACPQGPALLVGIRSGTVCYALKGCVCSGRKAKPGQCHVCVSWLAPSTSGGTACTGQPSHCCSWGQREARIHGSREFAKQGPGQRSSKHRLGKSPPDPQAPLGDLASPGPFCAQADGDVHTRPSVSQQAGRQARGHAGLVVATPAGSGSPARVSDGTGASHCRDSGVNANEAGRNESN